MGVTAAIIGATAAVAGTTSTIVSQAKAEKKANQQEAAMLKSMPNPADEAAKANVNAQSAAAQQKRRAAAAAGFASTELTGPRGITTQAPTTAKTLLGM